MLSLALALAITVTQADINAADCSTGRTPPVVAVQRMLPSSVVESADMAIIVDGRPYDLTAWAYDDTWNFCHGTGTFAPQSFFAVPN